MIFCIFGNSPGCLPRATQGRLLRVVTQEPGEYINRDFQRLTLNIYFKQSQQFNGRENSEGVISLVKLLRHFQNTRQIPPIPGGVVCLFVLSFFLIKKIEIEKVEQIDQVKVKTGHLGHLNWHQINYIIFFFNLHLKTIWACHNRLSLQAQSRRSCPDCQEHMPYTTCTTLV